MSIISKKQAINSIKETSQTVRGKRYPLFKAELGSKPFTHERVRIARSSRAQLIAAIDEFYRGYADGGDSYLVLKPAEAYDAREALDMMRDGGFANVSLRDAARFYMEAKEKKNSIVERTVGDAYAEYLAAIPETQEMQRKCVETRIGKFAEMFGSDRALSEVTSKEVVALMSKYENPKTWNNYVSYIKTFLNWCCASERGYLLANPCADVRLKAVAYVEPKFMPTDDVEKILREFEAIGDRRAMAFMMLSFFSGIRFAEIVRISENPSAVNLAGKTVRISMPKGWTKGIVPRVVPMQPNVVAWFEKYNLADFVGKMLPSEERKKMLHISRSLKVNLPKNSGRHTFITMHIAKFNNGQLTETICGTSKEMRANSYMGLATKVDAERYFAIMPKAD